MTTSRTTSRPAHDVKGGDTVILNGRYFDVFDTTVRGATVTIRLDGGRTGIRSLVVDADRRIVTAA